MSLAEDFYSLIFPNLCACCGNNLFKNEFVVCMKCNYHLPRTGFHLDNWTPVMETFAGRINPSHATALLYFNKGSHVQSLIHQLKYKGRKDVGVWFGQQMGLELAKSSFYKDIDLVVPVPLHPERLARRGYNQSEEFARGIADIMRLKFSCNLLMRNKASDTQTRKSRFSRWENVNNIFTLGNLEKNKPNHILLVDDVITTGATIEACYQELKRSGNVSISVAAIATAR